VHSAQKKWAPDNPYPKEVFIVLENNGEPYRKAVKKAEIALEKEKIGFVSNYFSKTSVLFRWLSALLCLQFFLYS
jgi:hypothetical protein